MQVAAKKKIQVSTSMIYLLLSALVLRLLIGGLYRGYDLDMNCFMGWADRLFSEGISSFYSGEGFSDYPPGYMYVLWLLGAIRKIFGMDYYSATAILLMKLPSMLCDLGAGYLIYLLAKERFGEKHGLICTALYVFSPAILINSTIWGQVDAVTTLFFLLVCYYVYKKKMPQSYVAFAIGFLIKPQMAFVFPIILMGIVDHVFLNKFTMKKFWVNLGCGLASIAGMALLMVPFGFSEVISQYVDTVQSYEYATVNAYNLWAMFGMNWHSQTEKILGLAANTWGTIFILLVFAAAALMWYKSKRNRSKYFFLAAFVVIGIFTLSVRMHERYMFYGLALMLCLYAVRPRLEFLIAYVALSIVNFINVWDILFNYDASNFDWEDPLSRAIGFFLVICFAFVCWLGKKYFSAENLKEEPEEVVSQIVRVISKKSEEKASKMKKSPIRPSAPLVKITKWDILIMVIISVVYGAIALRDLGDMDAPDNGWESHTPNEELIFEFEEGTVIKDIHYFLGGYHRPTFNIDTSDSLEGQWVNVMSEAEFVSVYKWQEVGLTESITDSYVKLTSLAYDAEIMEMVFVNDQDEMILPVNREEYGALFDEQDLYTGRATYLNSTYFDEIYHARTAKEYIDGEYSYENTHPPLGKVFISLGIRIFGMNPFGWRIAGALFGIAMLPFLYLFGKRMLKKSWLATAVTLLFAFDFMHFTQTRIATIDVFITFFVILMYYFMYRYSQMSFYDTSLQKTFRPLALCGISMGLGVASKWTGVYAGLGLAVIFFIVLYERFREYQYAKAHINGATGEIVHKEVVKKFPEYTKKTLLFCCLVFVVIPVCIYLLSYLPFDDKSGAGLLTQMINNQKTMFGYHSQLVSEHSFSSKWYQWPIMTRPIWYYSGRVSDILYEGISAFGNPLVWWVGIPAFMYIIYLAIANDDRNARFMALGYLAQYLPWVFISRTTYIYHYFPSVPFVVMMIGYSISRLVKENKRLRVAAFVYVAAAIGLFVLFYPVLSGHAVDKNFVYTWLRWFSSWQLIS